MIVTDEEGMRRQVVENARHYVHHWAKSEHFQAGISEFIDKGMTEYSLSEFYTQMSVDVLDAIMDIGEISGVMDGPIHTFEDGSAIRALTRRFTSDRSMFGYDEFIDRVYSTGKFEGLAEIIAKESCEMYAPYQEVYVYQPFGCVGPYEEFKSDNRFMGFRTRFRGTV